MDIENTNKPLWKRGLKADYCTLGEMQQILAYEKAEVDGFFECFGFDRAAIKGAVDEVYNYRNDAVHGNKAFDIGTIASVRSDWFHWAGRIGGIFSVFFR